MLHSSSIERCDYQRANKCHGFRLITEAATKHQVDEDRNGWGHVRMQSLSQRHSWENAIDTMLSFLLKMA